MRYAILTALRIVTVYWDGKLFTRVCVCVCVNILKQPYSSTPSVATQWLDMQLLVIARPLGLIKLITQSPNVSSETLRTTKRPDKRQQLCPVTE